MGGGQGVEKREKGSDEKRQKETAEETWEGSKRSGSVSVRKWETSGQREEYFIPNTHFRHMRYSLYFYLILSQCSSMLSV